MTEYYTIFFINGVELIKHGNYFETEEEAKQWLKEKITEGIGMFSVKREWTILKMYS